jgi:hypothetical protein
VTFMGEVPQSAEQYRRLVERLAELKQEIDMATGENLQKVRLNCSLHAQEAVITFLNYDPQIQLNGLVAPLAILHSGAHDSGRGAKPAIFNHTPTGPSDRPSGIIAEYVVGHLAYALEVLVKYGMGRNSALPWLAGKMARLGLRTEVNEPITSRQVDAWRSDISRARAPAVASAQFSALLQKYKPQLEKLSPDARKIRSQQIASAIVQNLANLAKNDAPRRRQSPRK